MRKKAVLVFMAALCLTGCTGEPVRESRVEPPSETAEVTEPQTIEVKITEPQTIELQATEPQTIELQVTELQTVESQATELQTGEVQTTKPQEAESKLLGTGEDEVRQEEIGKTEDKKNQQWKQAYIKYISDDWDRWKAEYESDLVNDFTYYLIYIDDDNIPELYVNSSYGAMGGDVCYYNGQQVLVTHIFREICTYIERQGLFCNPSGLSGAYSDSVYSIKDGQVSLIGYGEWGFMVVGTKTNEDGTVEGEYQDYYRWEDESLATEEEYNQRLNSVYDTTKAISPENGYSAYEIIEAINSF